MIKEMSVKDKIGENPASKKYFNTLGLTMALLCLALSLKGETKKRAAVMDFTANNTSLAYAKIVRNQIEVALYKTGYFDILEREKMELILKEQGLNVSGCIDTSCAVEIGKLLSVDFVVVGSLDKLGKFLLSVKFIEIQKGIVTHADTEYAVTENEIPDAIANLAQRASNMLKTGGTKSLTEEKAHVQKNEPGKNTISGSAHNPFKLPAFSMLGLSVLSFGGGFYFNTKAQALTGDYNTYAARYLAAANEAEAVGIHKSMTDARDKSDKNILFRNISYGAAAGFSLATGYLFYRYFSYTYTPPSTAGITTSHKINIVPIFMARREAGFNAGQTGGRFFMGGIIVRF
jgi:hypothetical protein